MATANQNETPKSNSSTAGPPPGLRALDDPTIQHEMISFKSGKDAAQGFLARPKATGRYRAVVVLHGDVGAPEGHCNTAAQLAQNGFVALTYKRFGRWPDLTLQDVIKSDQSDKRFLSGRFNDEELQDAQSGIDHLKTLAFVAPGGMGMLGFCGGGYQSLLLATRSKDVQAVVAFYAPPEMPPKFRNPNDPRPSLFDRVKQIKVPVQGHYGAADPVVSLTEMRKFEQALKTQGTSAAFFTYEGATHAFYDHTRRFYHAEAAAQAKGRMLEFFKRQLK